MDLLGTFSVLKFKAAPFGSATAWSAVNTVRDSTVTAEATEVDVSRKGSGFKRSVGGQRSVTLEFELLWEPGDPGFDAINDAFLIPNTLIAFAALDQEGATGNGPVGDFSITGFTRSEPNDDAITVSVTAKLTNWGQWTKTGAP